MREKVVVLHDLKRKAIHFTSTKLQGEDLWLPYDQETAELHVTLENLMVLNKIAHNVASVQSIRQCGVTEEFEVAYNAAT